MKKILFLMLLVPLFAQAEGVLKLENKASPNVGDDAIVRLICAAPNKVVVNHNISGVYTDENMPFGFVGKPWATMSLTEVPQYTWIEQLRCDGNKFTVDNNFKPDFVIKREQREQKDAELDNELAKPSPDVVKVLRLDRDIKKGK